MKRTRWAIVLCLVAFQASAKNEPVYSDVVSAKAPTVMEGDAQRDRFSNPLAGRPIDGLGANLEHAIVDDNKAVELDFVLVNHSDKEIVLPERVNSWGAYQWGFRVEDADGRSFVLRNLQSSWFGNAFSVFSIAPGSKHLMRCRLDPSSGEFRDGAVEVFSSGPRGAPRAPNTWVFPLTVVGTFEGIEENKREATWSGAISTKPLVIRKAHNKSLSAGAEDVPGPIGLRGVVTATPTTAVALDGRLRASVVVSNAGPETITIDITPDEILQPKTERSGAVTRSRGSRLSYTLYQALNAGGHRASRGGGKKIGFRSRETQIALPPGGAHVEQITFDLSIPSLASPDLREGQAYVKATLFLVVDGSEIRLPCQEFPVMLKQREKNRTTSASPATIDP